MQPVRARRTIQAAGLAVAAAVAMGLVGCSTQQASSSKPDDGTKLTMWVRSDGTITKALVDAYNAGHKNKIKLTIVPFDSYQQKVGAAAGAGALPDLLSADVVYSPNYVKQGLYTDITDRVKALPFAKDLTPAHSEAASRDGRIYGVPHVVDSSLLVYNKTLFKKAGLDPEAPPKDFAELYADAKAIREKVGGDTYGFFFAGNCPGCNAYTMFPYLAAAGTPPLVDDGTKADLDSPAMVEVLKLYRKMWTEKLVPSSAASEDGSTWSKQFVDGKIGIIPIGNFLFGSVADVGFEYGIAPLMAPDGSKGSTFVGGDVVGISKKSKSPDQAWDFIKWTLGDKAQTDVIAKLGGLPSRVDLAENQYSAKDPRVVQTIKGLATGYTPAALPYGEIFNDQSGPWLQGLRAAVLKGEDPEKVAATMQSETQKILDGSN